MMVETWKKNLALFGLVLSLLFSACMVKSIGVTELNKSSSLHEAVQSDNTVRVKELVTKGASIDETDSYGMTPLGRAVKRQNIGMVKLLLDLGANVKAGSGDYGTPLHLAVMGRGPDEAASIEIADLLISRGADLEAMGSIVWFTPLHQAAAWERVEMAALLLKRGAMVNSRSRGTSGATPLHTAVSVKRSYPMAKLLVDHGADLRARGNYGDTPLHTALINYGPSMDVVKLFLDHGADVNAHMEGAIFDWQLGATPLHMAVFFREMGIVELFISRGADVNARNAQGKTPLALAKDWEKRFGRPDSGSVIEVLQNHGGHE